ncbi:MAG TPA: C4-dicarboxylate transporter DctA [Vicinamibacterales bacterium]|nr:C4-dicarboxylate transporter DctA [Vicinamibacterales bacterium]
MAQGRRRFYRTLYGQVLVATVAGVFVGYLWPAAGVAMKPLGDAFIKLVRMIVAPIIFCTVVAGIAGAGEVKTVGRAGLVALVYFEIVTTIALIIGLVVVNVVRPGAGMNVDAGRIDAAAVAQYATAGKAQTATDFLLNLIPTTVVDAFARGDIIQVLVVSVLFGIALRSVGAVGRPLLDVVDRLSVALFAIVGIIMMAAPLGAFGAMAFTIASFGVGTLAPLVKVIACFYVTCLLFILAVVGAIARAHGFSVWRFIAYLREEIFIVYGTSSSESALPLLMEKLERLGVARSIVGLVVPAGYSFNLDGTAIYLSIATVFIAQATNTPLTAAQQLALLAILLITSKGAAGVAGAALIVLAGTLSATGTIPVAGVALILGIHRFMGEAMAVTNLIGNGVATIVVGRWCGEVDTARLAERLGTARVAARSASQV